MVPLVDEMIQTYATPIANEVDETYPPIVYEVVAIDTIHIVDEDTATRDDT